MLTPDIAKKSFAILLESCLNLSPQDELLAIYDDSLEPYLASLVDVVCDRSVQSTFIRIPQKQQQWLVREGHTGGHVQLPRSIQAAVSEASVILNLLDGKLETSAVRKGIIGLTRRGGARLAHIPGISDELLACLAHTDIRQTTYACELVAWVLGEANELLLFSKDARQHEYSLLINLNGWENEPLAGMGVIAPDSWGNVPPAEAFCCPARLAGNGEVCINGSLPDHGMADGEDFVLRFQDGTLVGWEVGNSATAAEFFELQKTVAEQRHDRNWCALAEVGIGLNPAIGALTGNSLVDEKAAKTAHIAIGDNSGFGHPISSDIHADFVIRCPTIRIDGHDVMRDGDLLIDELREWRRTQTFAGPAINPELKLAALPAKVEILHEEMFRRLTKAHRGGAIRMGDERRSRALAEAFQEIVTYGATPIGQFVEEHPSFGGIDSDDLVRQLLHYRVIILKK